MGRPVVTITRAQKAATTDSVLHMHGLARWLLAFALLVPFGVLGACSGSGNRQVDLRPTWINAPSSADTPGRLTGVGVGADRDEAEHAALANLSERIVARVQTESVVARTDEQVGQGSDLTARSNVIAESLARVSSDVRLLGAQIDQIVLEQEGSSEPERVYALASLDIETAHSAHLAEARSAIEAARASFGAGATAEEPLARAGALGRGVRESEVAAENFAVAAGLRPHDEAAMQGLFNATAARRQGEGALRDALVEVKVAPVATRSAPESATLAATNAVRAIGATVVTPGDEGASLRLFIDVAIETLRSYDERQSLRRWTVTLEARTGDGGLLDKQAFEGVVTAPEATQADAQATREAVTRVRREGEALLRAVIFGAQ
jgi:hypothetical protein